MTKSATEQGCRWCRAPVAERPGPGRKKRYCRPVCRQAAYRARRLAAGHGLADGEVVVRVDDLEALADATYVLAAALEDVEHDLTASSRRADVLEALEHLQEAARPLAGLQLHPLTDR